MRRRAVPDRAGEHVQARCGLLGMGCAPGDIVYVADTDGRSYEGVVTAEGNVSARPVFSAHRSAAEFVEAIRELMADAEPHYEAMHSSVDMRCDDCGALMRQGDLSYAVMWGESDIEDFICPSCYEAR